MARGDYIEVTYRTGAGVAKEKIVARTVGSGVEVTIPTRSNDFFVIVVEVDKSRKAIRTARFATGEVMSIIEGHETIGRPEPAKIKK